MHRMGILLAILGCHTIHAGSVQYVEDFSDIRNPERGFYYQLESRSDTPDPLSNYAPGIFTSANTSVIRRLYNMLSFRSSLISNAFLQHIVADLDYARQHGLKLNIRFAYTFNESPPNDDAPRTLIEQHIEQLHPLLQAHADVISHLDAGFIGRYGEWHGSTSNNDNNVTRTAVLNALLAALPPERTVVVRTPTFKRDIFDRETPLDGTEAFNSSNVARTGHLNDCLLASDTNFGTYWPPDPASIAEQKAYIAAETRFVPLSGETCAVNPPRSDCPTALAELAQLHFSILNYTYHPDVLQSWQTQGCFEQIRRRLGYRLVLRESILPEQISPNGRFIGQLRIQNIGFAAPFNPRGFELLLRRVGNPAQVFRLPIAADPRRWLPDQNNGNHSIALDLALPNLPLGSYELLLALPDPKPSISARADYAIRLANTGTWEAVTGWNRLLANVTVVVDEVFGNGFE